MSSAPTTLRVEPRWTPTHLTRRLVALTGLLLVLVVVQPGAPTLVPFASVTVVLVFVASAPRPDLLMVEVVRPSRRTVVGEEVVVRLRLGVPRPRATLTAQLYAHPAFTQVQGQPWVLGDEVALRLSANQWVRDSPGTVVLTATAPLGGWSARAWIRLPEVIVHPAVHPVARVGAPARALSRLGVHTSRTRGVGTDFADIQQYATGDLIRDVNWKASARAQTLMVSRRYTDQSADVVILLDHTHVHGYYDARGLERAVTGAAALASRHLSEGDRVGLVLFGGQLGWVEPGHGRAHRIRLFDEMVRRPFEESFVSPLATRIPAAAMPPRAVVVVFSGLFDDRMLTATTTLAHRGHRIVVVDTAGLEPPQWPEGVLPETQERWREQRALLRADLAVSGVVVVDDAEAVAMRAGRFPERVAGR